MTGARLRLLGGFALENGSTAGDLTPGMQRLLALLALRGPSHRRVVAGTLWPEVPESQALASLRTVVWRTGRVAPGVVTTDGTRLGVSGAVVVDSLEQEAFSTEVFWGRAEDAEWIRAGMAILLRGDLLPGWYDEWVVRERDRLGQLRLHALEHAATLLTERARLDEALLLALEAVRAEPLRETANRALMAVYLAEGNISDALRHYEGYRRLLRRELGLEPSAGLSALVRPWSPAGGGSGGVGAPRPGPVAGRLAGGDPGAATLQRPHRRQAGD